MQKNTTMTEPHIVIGKDTARVPLTAAEDAALTDLLLAMCSPKKLDHLRLEIARRALSATSPEDRHNAANAICKASTYEPPGCCISQKTVVGQNKRFPIHNATLARFIQTRYTAETFADLFELCGQHGVFDLSTNEQTGLNATSGGAENALMHKRTWITDVVETMPLQGRLAPKSVPRAVLTICEFYATADQQASIRQCVQDPNWYRKGDKKNGPAHIFYPDTLQRDPDWHANNRQESHARALGILCMSLIMAAVRNIFTADHLLMADIAGSLAAFLAAINTDPETGHINFAQSSGPWEEIAFAGGLTHDVYQVAKAFDCLRLLRSVQSAGLRPIKQRLLAKAPGLTLHRVKDLIAAAESLVRYRLLGASPCEHPQRQHDAALFWVLKDCKLSDEGNPFSDARTAFRLLDQVCGSLQRENGMIRYQPFELEVGGAKVTCEDSYLAQDYWLPDVVRWYLHGTTADYTSGQSFGSEDCSDLDAYLRRTASMPKNTPAEWAWNSVAAHAYAYRTCVMLRSLAGKRRGPNAQERAIIEVGIAGATEEINRSFARITDTGAIKSNGRRAPSWAVPEAYELVSTWNGGKAALPGVNTPFGWGQSTLFEASREFAEMLVLANLVMN